LHRFFSSSAKKEDRSLVLEGSEAYHAARVLRVERGDSLTVLNGKGDQFDCRVLAVSKSSVQLDVLGCESRPPLPCSITLLQTLPKGKLMEAIVQKATELGVWQIVPLLSVRSEVKLSPKDKASKLMKWESTAKEACKQCGGLWLPKIESPQRLEEWLNKRVTYDLSLVASLEAQTHSQRYWFNRFYQKEGRQPRSIALWIGPEGDFSPEEYQLLKQNDVLPITLGPLVLRCETAAVSAIAIALSECREF
jgi:16S rRNA (uracil1498-N3)-methyltransferase